MKKWTGSLIASAVFAASDSYGLSLGPMDVNSALFQPFKAEIALPAVRPSDLRGLHVSFAPATARREDGLEPSNPADFRFTIAKDAAGNYRILIRSRKPINEPILSFTLEASWDSGHILRSYDVLLDPPDGDDAEKTIVAEAPQPAEAAEHTPPAVPEAGAPERVAFDEGFYDNHRYGPTTERDTLSDIAAKMRPDDSISRPQVMMALFRQNPEAFVDNNINLLKAGYVLHLKNLDSVTALPAAAAAAAVAEHNREWRSPSAAEKGLAEDVPETDNSGRIIRDEDVNSAIGAPATTAEPDGAIATKTLDDLRLELAAKRAEVEQLGRENELYKERIARMEQQVATLLAGSADDLPQ